jgi:hypothetical protein
LGIRRDTMAHRRYLRAMSRGSSLAHRQPDPAAEARAGAELLAMENVARLLLRNIEQIMRATGSSHELQSREGRLQLEVFEERRAQVMRLLDLPAQRPAEPRIARLARLVEGLQFSRAYFRKVQLSASRPSFS